MHYPAAFTGMVPSIIILMHICDPYTEAAELVWGWEDFEDGINGTQSYFDVDTMQVHIEGYQIRDPGSTTLGYLALCVYDADVAPDGQHLINGVWIGGMPGTWEAELVPEPATIILVGLGGLIVFRKR